MRTIWAIRHKVELWHRVWLSVAIRQSRLGLIDLPNRGLEQLTRLLETDRVTKYEEETAAKLEKAIEHDLVAQLMGFKKTLPDEIAPFIHCGLTSSDVEDLADLHLIDESILSLRGQLNSLFEEFNRFIAHHAKDPVLGRTHLQPAVPTTFGYRFLVYFQEMAMAAMRLEVTRLDAFFIPRVPGGAVGTGESEIFLSMVAGNLPETRITNPQATGQTYPRTQDLRMLQALDELAACCLKMFQDIRLMQMESVLQEPTLGSRIGSSAMPGKANPILSEKGSGLARMLHGHVQTAWEMASSQMLERSLDDSSVRRFILPESFLLASELISLVMTILTTSSLNLDLAKKEVHYHWRSWLPSRVLTLLRASGIDVMNQDLISVSMSTTSPEHFLFDARQRWPCSKLENLSMLMTQFGPLYVPEALIDRTTFTSKGILDRWKRTISYQSGELPYA